MLEYFKNRASTELKWVKIIVIPLLCSLGMTLLNILSGFFELIPSFSFSLAYFVFVWILGIVIACIIYVSRIYGRKTTISRSQLKEPDTSVANHENLSQQTRIQTTKPEIHNPELHSNLENFSMLASGLAHDLNNILTTVTGNLSISLLEIENSELRDNIEIALSAAQSASGLTAQMLRFSKGGEPIKLNASLPEIIVDSTKFVLAGSSVAVQYSFPEHLPFIKVDPDQISQVIQNIVLNAKQAMNNQGNIEIKAETCPPPPQKTTFTAAQEYIRITIRDTGPGIPSHIQENIFQPNFTTKATGNGLGLASSQSIIQKHNGILNFSSLNGKGTEFYIYLPLSTVDSEV